MWRTVPVCPASQTKSLVPTSNRATGPPCGSWVVAYTYIAYRPHPFARISNLLLYFDIQDFPSEFCHRKKRIINIAVKLDFQS